MGLTWDFSRQLDSAATPGNTTSYYDEQCQSFYLDAGTIRTQIANLPEGQWQDIEREPELIISPTGIAALDIEHHYNGIVAGSAQHNADVVLFIYEYMADVSPWLKDGSYQLQPDNPIKAGSITIKNGDKARFEDDSFTLFAPGNRLTMRFIAGDSDPYEFGTVYIEQSPYDETGDSFAFRGRNLLGFHLANQTFDERTSYTGTLTSIFTTMMTDAGILANKILVQSTATTGTFTFNPSDSFLTGMQQATAFADWYFDDLPDGTIVVGDAAFIRANAASTGIYSFDRGSNVISRAVERNLDGVYSRVCVRRGGPVPLSIYADVPYFDGWFIAGHRTFYQDVADDITQATMQAICDQMVEGLQYSGITEKFDSPFRPWLQIGDVASVTGGDTPRLAGIITDIQHQFGESGFFTQFTVTSGGTISNPDNPATVASKYVGRMGGANRQRRLMDYIQSGARASVDTNPVGAVVYQAAVSGGYLGDEQTLNGQLAKIAVGAVLPTGGTAGQVLSKVDADDYDTVWIDPASGSGIPDGGTTGQVLAKASDTNGDAGWVDPASASGDVVGPGASVDSRLAAFDGLTGKLLKDSGKSASDFASATHDHNPVYYHGFGNACGSNTAGVTFAGYGAVRAIKTGNTYRFYGEVRITTRTGAGAADFQTGISIANVLSVLGITDTLTYKGNYHNRLEIFTAAGAKLATNDSNYGYGFVAEHNSGILNCARYYTTTGDIGGWGSSGTPYAVGNVWMFEFVMEAS